MLSYIKTTFGKETLVKVTLCYFRFTVFAVERADPSGPSVSDLVR
jgi:hypothetical protein